MFNWTRQLFVCGCLLISITICAQTADPTRPLGQAVQSLNTGASTESGYNLTSILISDTRKVAIINGELVHEQQQLKGTNVLVKKIAADAVTLQQGANQWVLKFHSTNIRQPQKSGSQQ